ncbi:MAG: NAD(P)/FAD-dependent oxidoreductase [Hyphomicrobiales bacterium]|nr:NAD(P)/FAD-dependent oxidoreductase [Hyphomicrobiales bacterium]
METTDCIVVGAGVVGLAVARTLSASGREVLLLEAEARIGEHTSSRNSEVIHAGLYYKPGSLRQHLFPRAPHLLYAYCAEHGVPHRRLGKLVVARHPHEVEVLRLHMAHATAAGLHDLAWLEPDEAQALEPNLACYAAYLSPSSGIVDSHALMLAYQSELERNGGALVVRAPVTGAAVMDDGIRVAVGGAEPMTLHCKTLVNCAGHGAPPLARAIEGLPATLVPRNFFRRGVYFSVTGRPFKRLIYPVHAKGGGMDIHAVIDMAGNVRFGPDVEWVDRLDYSVDPGRAEAFYHSVRSFWPALADGALSPAYAGIRPKITGPDEPVADFVIQGPREHGIPHLVNLFGIESPGLTASLAIGEYVAGLLGLSAPMPALASSAAE